jgi:hypothetical protein
VGRKGILVDVNGVGEDDSGNVIPFKGQAAVEIKTQAPRKARSRRFHMVWGMIDLPVMTRLYLTATQSKVFYAIAARTNRETGTAHTTIADLARDVDLSQPQVHRTVAELLARRIVFRLSRYELRINAHLGYRGEAADWEEATASDPHPIWEKE